MQTLLQPKPPRINPDLRPDADPQKLERLPGDTLNRHLAEIGCIRKLPIALNWVRVQGTKTPLGVCRKPSKTKKKPRKFWTPMMC